MIDLRRFAPLVTRNLIIINVLIWFAQVVFQKSLHINLVELLGLHYVEASDFHFYQFVTYMFLHSSQGLDHIFFNIFSLWMLGSTIEKIWGSQRYLIFYLVCGLSAALVQELVWMIDFREVASLAPTALVNLNGEGLYSAMEVLNMPVTVGASGAVFGILLAFGMLLPNAELFLFFIPIPIKAKYYVVAYALIELFFGVSSAGSNIAHFAHLGGMLGGLILILYWRRKSKMYY